MQLTKEQAVRLLEVDLWNVIEGVFPGRGKILSELQDLGLVHLLEQKVLGQQKKLVWRLTELGEETLNENILTALTHIQAPGFILGTAYGYFRLLSIKELPVLLTHPNSKIREFARARILELKGYGK